MNWNMGVKLFTTGHLFSSVRRVAPVVVCLCLLSGATLLFPYGVVKDVDSQRPKSASAKIITDSPRALLNSKTAQADGPSTATPGPKRQALYQYCLMPHGLSLFGPVWLGSLSEGDTPPLNNCFPGSRPSLRGPPREA